MPISLLTPGVKINEINAFPNSVVPVATAIPAFVGYTAAASYQGKDYTGVPVRLESFQEFLAYFAKQDADRKPRPDAEQYTPHYEAVPVKDPAIAHLTIGNKPHCIVPDPNTIYYLYNAIKLFYLNGGGTCYVVSVGGYGNPSGQLAEPGKPIVNANILSSQLLAGLEALKQEDEPTIIVIPDAVLLEREQHAKVNQQILVQCQELQSRVGVLDVYNGQNPDRLRWMGDIDNFRADIGQTGLNYGICYYPFLKTSVITDEDINFTNFGGLQKLASVLPEAARSDVAAVLSVSEKAGTGGQPNASQVESALRNTSATYKLLCKAVVNQINILPPSAAMAGAFTLVDRDKGVWHAPANISLLSVVDTTVKINDLGQSTLNVHAATGKSINVIRMFPGRGPIVWGARTLDGNSQDWRYLSVRRTLIMLEQSMKLAANAYVFEPNDANTWSLVRSMLANFLTSMWAQGALVGPTPAAAFSVNVGLGVTMTPQDILDGVMNVSVKVAVSHPAEFIVITIQQQMQSAS